MFRPVATLRNHNSLKNQDINLKIYYK